MCYNPKIAELNITFGGKKTMVFRNTKQLTNKWQKGHKLVSQYNDYPNKQYLKTLPKKLRMQIRKAKSLVQEVIPTRVACRKCEACLERKSKEWAIRAVHESKLYKSNIAVTFTINEESMKKRGHRNVDRREFQLFMKRLRKYYEKSGNNIRVLYAAEYGEKTQRPHYHAILYNCEFSDKKFEKKTGAGTKLYVSETLNKIWGLGKCWIGEVNHKSAAYIARYTMKKLYGKSDKPVKEFIQASNRPRLSKVVFRQVWFNRCISMSIGWIKKATNYTKILRRMVKEKLRR